MASTLVKIDVHIIFHVKVRGTPIIEQDLPRLFAYMGGILKNRGSIPIEIGGMPDHIHILASLPKTKTISELVRDLKSDSTLWIKTINPHYYGGFSWQDGYGAFSISPSVLPNVVRYIRNQVEHHKVKTFIDEYKMFLKAYGVEYDERYAFGE